MNAKNKRLLDSKVAGYVLIGKQDDYPILLLRKKEDGNWNCDNHGTSSTIDTYKVLELMKDETISWVDFDNGLYFYVSVPDKDASNGSIFIEDAVFDEYRLIQYIANAEHTSYAEIDTIVLYAYEHDSKCIIDSCRQIVESMGLKFILVYRDI